MRLRLRDGLWTSLKGRCRIGDGWPATTLRGHGAVRWRGRAFESSFLNNLISILPNGVLDLDVLGVGTSELSSFTATSEPSFVSSFTTTFSFPLTFARVLRGVGLKSSLSSLLNSSFVYWAKIVLPI